LGDELTNEEGDSKDEGDAPTEAGPIEEGDPEEDPSEEEPMEEEDPKEDLSEEEPMEEEGPEEDSEVSEGKLMGRDDLEGDFIESETEAIEKENLKGD